MKVEETGHYTQFKPYAPEKRGSKLLLPFAALIYGVVETGRLVVRGSKYTVYCLSGELASACHSVLNEATKAVSEARSGVRAVGHLLKVGTDPYLSETVGLTGSTCREAGKAAKHLRSGLESTSGPVFEVSGRVCAEAGTYLVAGSKETGKAGGSVLDACLHVSTKMGSEIYHLVAEVVGYLPPGLYQLHQVIEKTVEIISQIKGQSCLRDFAHEVKDYCSSADRIAVRSASVTLDESELILAAVAELVIAVVGELDSHIAAYGSVCCGALEKGAREFHALSNMGGSAGRKGAAELASYIKVLPRETRKGLLHIPPLLWTLTPPLLRGIRVCVAEIFSMLKAGECESAKAVHAGAEGLVEGTQIPRAVLKAAVLEIMGLLVNAHSELSSALESVAKGAVDIAGLLPSLVQPAGQELIECVEASRSESEKVGRRGSTSLGHLVQVPQPVVEAIAIEILSYLSAVGNQSGRTWHSIVREWVHSYQGMVSLPVESWYYMQKELLFGEVAGAAHQD